MKNKKIVVITGGSRGIGFEAAKQFVKAGDKVYITYLKSSKSYFKENGFFPEHTVPLPDQINNINKILKENDQLNVIDLHSTFVDAEGYLNTKYSGEGVHLNEAGYSNWANFINDKIASLK